MSAECWRRQATRPARHTTVPGHGGCWRNDDGDIIVSDLRLPDGECTEVLERMREAGIRNPFVIMTDYAQVASAVSSMRLGAEDYIPKTLLQEKLLPRISELVRKSERRHTMPIRKEGIPYPYWSAEVPHSGPSTGVSHW